MKNILITIFCVLCCVCAQAQEGYGGVGVGYSEACTTKGSPSFAGGDCVDPNVNLRGLVGKQINDYFALEGSFDISFDSGDAMDSVLSALVSEASDTNFYCCDSTRTSQWSITTLAVHAFAELPVTRSVRLFAGPSLGGSIVNFEYDYTNSLQEHSATEAGLNYGWAAGVDVIGNEHDFIRLQWQNWYSLDTNVVKEGEITSSTITLNFISYF